MFFLTVFEQEKNERLQEAVQVAEAATRNAESEIAHLQVITP